MSQLAVFKTANLPPVKAMSAALKTVRVADVGTAILKMDKTGHWVFGADQTEIEEGSTWAINPLSFIHGFICWGKNEVLGEKMVPITEPLPELDPAPAGSQRGWEPQIGFSVRCMSGEDKDMEMRFATSSVGGRRAVQELGLLVAAHIEEDSKTPVPIVTLDKDHYSHKQYGKIYTPVFNIVKWISMDAEEAAPKADAKAEATAETTAGDAAPTETGRRRRAR